MAEKKVKLSYMVGNDDRSSPGRAHGGRNRAQTAEFFSFGTNDLTQTALGISRDDMGNFLMPARGERKSSRRTRSPRWIRVGVGQLMKIAVEKGQRLPPGIARHLWRTRRRS